MMTGRYHATRFLARSLPAARIASGLCRNSLPKNRGRRESQVLVAPAASHPAFVTMANAPLSGETGEFVRVICPTSQAKNICRWDWTTQISLKKLIKFVFMRTRFARLGRLRAARSGKHELICPDVGRR